MDTTYGSISGITRPTHIIASGGTGLFCVLKGSPFTIGTPRWSSAWRGAVNLIVSMSFPESETEMRPSRWFGSGFGTQMHPKGVASLSLMDRPKDEAQEHDPAFPLPSPPVDYSREGLRHQVLVHLSILEDFSPHDFRSPDRGHAGSPSDTEDKYPSCVHFFWTAGIPDGVER